MTKYLILNEKDEIIETAKDKNEAITIRDNLISDGIKAHIERSDISWKQFK